MYRGAMRAGTGLFSMKERGKAFFCYAFYSSLTFPYAPRDQSSCRRNRQGAFFFVPVIPDVNRHFFCLFLFRKSFFGFSSEEKTGSRIFT